MAKVIRDGDWWNDENYLDSAEITKFEASVWGDYLENYIDLEEVQGLLYYYDMNEHEFWEEFRDSYYEA